MKSNNRSFGSVFFSVLGLILLALILTAVVLFFVCRAKMADAELHLDDIAAFAHSEPDRRTQHLSFSPDARMTVTFDKSDLWYFLYRYYEGEKWLEDTNNTLSELHLALTGLGMEISEDGIIFDVEMVHRNTRLAFRVACKVSFADGVITVRPNDLIVLGHKISLSRFTSTKLAKLLHITKQNIAFTYDPELTFLKQIETISLGDGTLSLTGEMATEYLEQNVISALRIMVMRFSQRDCCYAAPVLADYCDDPRICFATLLPLLQDDPGIFTEFLDQFFTLKTPKFLELESKNEGILYRWFPQYREDYTQISFEVREEYEVSCKILKSIALYSSEAFSAKKTFSVLNGALTYKKAPFAFDSFYGYNFGTYRSIIDFENARPCLYIRSTVGYGSYPPVSRLIDSEVSLSAPVVPDLGYAPGILVRGADGFPYVLAFTGGEEFEAMVLEEEYFRQLMDCEVFPVADIRPNT